MTSPLSERFATKAGRLKPFAWRQGLGTPASSWRWPSMADAIANLIGSAAAICSISSFAPQAYKIWKERDASAVSVKTYALTVACFILWTIYGAMTSAWPIVAANACALVMASAVLFMKWRFGDKAPARA